MEIIVLFPMGIFIWALSLLWYYDSLQLLLSALPGFSSLLLFYWRWLREKEALNREEMKRIVDFLGETRENVRKAKKRGEKREEDIFFNIPCKTHPEIFSLIRSEHPEVLTDISNLLKSIEEYNVSIKGNKRKKLLKKAKNLLNLVENRLESYKLKAGLVSS